MSPSAGFVVQVPDVAISALDHKVFQYPPSLLQIFPNFLRQLTTSSLTKHFGQVSDINSDLIRKVIDVLLRPRNFLGGCDMMSMGRWQGVCEETLLTQKLTITLTNDLAGNGSLGMNSNAAWSGFDSRMLLTLARIAGSLSSSTRGVCRETLGLAPILAMEALIRTGL